MLPFGSRDGSSDIPATEEGSLGNVSKHAIYFWQVSDSGSVIIYCDSVPVYSVPVPQFFTV